MSATAKAAELMEKGDKKTKKFFGGSSKYEDARELYLQGANQYKKVQDWPNAAGAFMKCFQMSQKVKSESDMISDLMEAANCYRKFDYKQATATMGIALDLLDKGGRYDRAAKLCMESAKIFEGILEEEGGEKTMELNEQILMAYEKARDYYKLMRNSTTHANDCAAKIAAVKILQGKYDEALEIYEDLGKHCAEDNLLRFNAKSHFFTALLCQLPLISPMAADPGIDKFRDKFEEYTELDLQFCDTTHEYELCKNIIKAFEDGEVAAYTEAYRRYDKIIPFDKPKEVMVLKGKQILNKRVEDCT
eukprot:TRINITY_DN5228_c0_g1_i2.p1 TRINITY_DN5228_c0_g1~~TRINITY_DN5228_c0_g1_i2.p1  ORF type:complete len:325 (+),score=112.01 TRINITY_DN5228_c0_g1_i2:62-976(+)